MRYADIYERINLSEPRTLNVVFPNSRPVFDALAQADEKKYIQARLYGIPARIKELAEAASLKEYKIIPSSTADEAVWKAIADIRAGLGDCLMKSDIPTASFLGPVLNREKGLRKGELLSHTAVCDTPNYHKLLFLTDGAINIELNTAKKEAIAVNGIELCERILQRKPRVAFAAIIEKLNPKIPSTLEAGELAEIFSKRGYEAEGPMALDVILNAEAAEKKGISSQISGDVDLIVCPHITVCNFMLKQMIELEHAAVGGLIMGAQVPLILLSRSDRASEKLNSIVLSLVQ